MFSLVPRCHGPCGSAKKTLNIQGFVYTDNLPSYNALDVTDFHHYRINHSDRFVEATNHINGIENFWNQAKRHLQKYNGIPQAHFPLFLKECEWRFNYEPLTRLVTTFKDWVKPYLK